MRVLVVLLLSVTAALSGCESLPQADGLLARSSEAFKNSRERLAELAQRFTGNPEEEQRHAEVQRLFDQGYIDPLTRYIQQHDGDADYAPYLEVVRAERSERCSVVASRYAAETADPATLGRLKRGYNLSCPEVVDNFAQRVAGAQSQEQPPARIEEISAAVEKPAAPTKPAAARSGAASSEAKDCYLLFSIKNFQQAAAPCEAAGAAGDAKAQHHLAVMAQTGQDSTRALSWARQSAEQGDASGQLLLAKLLSAEGEKKEAFTWLQRAANQGQREADYLLAKAYHDGNGTPINRNQAQVYLQRAASAGDIPAMLQLASQQQGSPSARHWLKQAARRNSADAQYKLGMDYLEGTSGDINLQEAYVWLSLALVNGDNRGKRSVEQLSGRLSAEELTQAQSRIHSGLNGL
ncbi:MAG: tetratricopeptide repeat protein [Halopseudomonas sp.]|uniref:tetratricopeptide repeat protein n=1 Tax=Halopseudomonas sp. TaxID=2901191 RepID=UPI003001756D